MSPAPKTKLPAGGGHHHHHGERRFHVPREALGVGYYNYDVAVPRAQVRRGKGTEPENIPEPGLERVDPALSHLMCLLALLLLTLVALSF